MTDSRTWTVRPSRFPFGVSVEAIGVVNGDTRADAQRRAEELYGRGVVVELTHSPNSSEHSRQKGSNGGHSPRRTERLHQVQSPLRDMTADEAQMARALSTCAVLRTSRHRGTIRMLHARTFTANRTINEAEATLLRATVIALASQLPANIVAMAEVSRG